MINSRAFTNDFTESETLEHSDLILLNTCAIRENAENRVFGELGRLKKYKRNNGCHKFIINIIFVIFYYKNTLRINNFF